MPIKLRNRGRSPITIDLASLGKIAQVDLRVGRDRKTGATGAREVKQAFPRSVTIPARGESEELPDAVRADPALAGRADIEIIAAGVKPKES